ncbi:transglutaminase-like domain-containing protein [Paenibacillus macquariensis]|uniref:Transglutaminase-like superfamily protein n=1 Tax=Paenibacillus macquariensis TaxID=948756 RepID=A0ABY1KBR6_9BACL|nr:transglutaminase-like domain-containing protein [Paenibacillus macquariensis]MEC0093566.1 transglutaminase-like domain-containing protein [Paenibacillus macquariensis]OAB29829.1 hypothetical protein PMSM_23065 [Paenibacillus macquariensis subsp. macquariensis]SIR56410.1 Transglutaminase-like superfamily protein [Paenibacillus macquariensis]
MTVPIQNGEIATYNPIGIAPQRTDNSLHISKRGDTLLYRCILSLPIMGLFAEWLFPLSNEYFSLSAPLIEVLYGLTALLLLVGMFHSKKWISIPLHLVLTVGAWALLFGQDGGLDWFISYGAIAQHDFTVVIQEGNLNVIGPETRTLILMMGWSLLVSTVQSLALYRGSIGLFATATLVYLLCLEKLLGLEVYPDIIRTALLLVILYGGISLSRLLEGSSSSYGISNRKYSAWFVIVCVVGTMVVGAAWMSGKVISVEPTKQISIKAAVEKLKDWSGVQFNQRDARTAVTGYGSGEQDLGVPLKLSSKTEFTAESPVRSYWRGETFGYYDGRRWSEPQAYFNAVDKKANLQNDSLLSKDSEQKSIVQTIHFDQPMKGEFPLFSGGFVGQVTNITTMDGDSAVYLLHDEIADTLKYPGTVSSSPVASYQVEVTLPSINAVLLRKASGSDPESITKRYLQLPEQLPVRVKELGVQMTSNTNNRYDAVWAVQTYLQNNYKYSLNTSVPPANQDFVDNFLFETRLGYCNHFSTSMVVLLRSQGIPSRLVKGYAPGTLEDGSSTTYDIKSSDAHSWVEVYFPQMGWIPFDPTPGISDQEEFSESVAITKPEGDNKGSIVNFITDRMDQLVGMVSEMRIATVEAGYFIPGMIVVTTLITATIISIWKSRRYLRLWKLRYITRSNFPQKEQLLQAALLIWDEVGRRYGFIPKGVTIREYVHSLSITDENLRGELVQFVDQWESIAYDKVLLNRVQSISFLQRCTTLAHSLS